ncbi:MAG TPA: carboxypeptidase M32 [Chloroflexaceae bacterium]|nr:carboxypeptidase M32 [Chloroflexaceae bacterium]
MEAQMRELRARLSEIGDLNAAAAVLSWDQNTHMPPGGAAARGRQLATLRRLGHEKATDEALGALLEALAPYEQGLPYDHDDAALVRVARRQFERSARIPPALVAELAAQGAASYNAWTRARPANDVATMIPHLERTLELSRRVAECFPGYEHIADPLIDGADYGMRAETVRRLFAELRDRLVPLAQAITARPPADDSCLRQHYPEAAQRAFGELVARQFGYDFSRGRQDKTAHPFAIRFASGDVRITTRFDEHNLAEGLFSTLHEAGHAMYEQGVNPAYDGTPLARGTSAGVHESQSRLWENLVGRSRPFWEHSYPQLQAAFPAQLGAVPLDTFYRAINKVERSLIRTDADEVTYNLHVMIRFDLELAMLEGRLAVKDLPEAWNERYRADLGIAPPEPRDGVLQDVHWFYSTIGGSFQGYTIGNILSAQFFQAARTARPEIDGAIGRGEFGALHAWLREQIYVHGSKYTTAELVERVTGEGLTIEPYMAYLAAKYGELYGL